MKYRANASDTWHKIKIKALDSMPIGSVVEYVGQASDIPQGWEAISGGKIQKTSETTPTMASIVNDINTSTKDAYSCKYITDNFNGNRIYSLLEVNTGKIWIDNKPIYRKVVSGIVPTGIGVYIYTDTNIDSIVDYYGLYYQGTSYTKRINFYFSSTDYMTLNFNAIQKKFVLDNTSNYNNIGTIDLIVEYTKTTD